MKLIDEKGRLFGKINLIDFLAALFLIVVIIMFYFSYKIVTKKRVRNVKNVEIKITANITELNPSLLNLIKPGDKEFDKDGKIIGEITWLGQAKPQNYMIALDDKCRLAVKDNVLLELPVKLKLSTKLKDNKLYYNGEEILIYPPFSFKTKNYSIKVIPVPVNGEDEKWIQTKVRFMGLSPELATMISKGHIERDRFGRIIGELREIETNTPSQVSVLKLEENKAILITDPYRNDVVALLNLLCVNDDGAMYFKNYPVKIGSQIIFSSDLYTVTGSIIGIEELNK